MKGLRLLLLLALSHSVTTPAFGQFCGDHPIPQLDVMTFMSTIPGYPSDTMLLEMSDSIRLFFRSDDDGVGVDTACCYVPDLLRVPITLPAELGCDVITWSNIDMCFDALGANKVGIVEEIIDCSQQFVFTSRCTRIDTSSSFLARTNPFGAPDDALFWWSRYLKTALFAELGYENVNVNGNLFNRSNTWDGTLALDECSTVLSHAEAPVAGERCLCHSTTLTSNSFGLPNGDPCTSVGDACLDGLCVAGPPFVDPGCAFLVSRS